MAKVSLKNVSGIAVSDVTFEIANRGFLVLTGPSGSGKTALLRMIAGLEEPSAGEILIDERNVNGVRPAARDIAMVFASDSLYPGMSVRENIEFGLKRRKFSETETKRRVEDAAAALGIESHLARRPTDLSLEDRQRVAIARAIARQPKVLLFDEPLSYLETATRVRMRAEIRKLHERLETSVIYATRDAAEAMALGQQLAVMNDGRIAQNDSAQSVHDLPANLFVAGFLGSPTMNFLHGTIKVERDFLLFTEAGEGTVRVRLPLSDSTAAGKLAGQAVVLGVRSEDVEIVTAAKGEAQSENSFAALVDLIEPVGAEAIFHLATGAHDIMARGAAPSGNPLAGRRVRFRFDPSKARLFDPASTLRLLQA